MRIGDLWKFSRDRKDFGILFLYEWDFYVKEKVAIYWLIKSQ